MRRLVLVMLLACRHPSADGDHPDAAVPTTTASTAAGPIVEAGDALPEDWCIDESGPPSVDVLGNDRVVAPFRISAREAVSRVRSSKHVASLGKPVGNITLLCARRCAIPTPECGFSLTLHDMDRHGFDDPTLTPSSWMGVVYVEPVTRTLWWEDFAADGAGAWRSEPL